MKLTRCICNNIPEAGIKCTGYTIKKRWSIFRHRLIQVKEYYAVVQCEYCGRRTSVVKIDDEILKQYEYYRDMKHLEAAFEEYGLYFDQMANEKIITKYYPDLIDDWNRMMKIKKDFLWIGVYNNE